MYPAHVSAIGVDLLLRVLPKPRVVLRGTQAANTGYDAVQHWRGASLFLVEDTCDLVTGRPVSSSVGFGWSDQTLDLIFAAGSSGAS